MPWLGTTGCGRSASLHHPAVAEEPRCHSTSDAHFLQQVVTAENPCRCRDDHGNARWNREPPIECRSSAAIIDSDSGLKRAPIQREGSHRECPLALLKPVRVRSSQPRAVASCPPDPRGAAVCECHRSRYDTLPDGPFWAKLCEHASMRLEPFERTPPNCGSLRHCRGAARTHRRGLPPRRSRRGWRWPASRPPGQLAHARGSPPLAEGVRARTKKPGDALMPNFDPARGIALMCLAEACRDSGRYARPSDRDKIAQKTGAACGRSPSLFVNAAACCSRTGKTPGRFAQRFAWSRLWRRCCAKAESR